MKTGRHALSDTTGNGLLFFWWAFGVVVVLVLLFTVGGVGAAMAQMPLIGAQCPTDRLESTAVTVTVAPELETGVRKALEAVPQQRVGKRCVTVAVTAQESATTVAGSRGTPATPAPDLWIPDSSLWRSLVPWTATSAGSLASSPVVIATGQQTAAHLGWTGSAPSWQQALTGSQPLAVPDLPADAPGLSAVISLWQSLGKGEAAQNALAAVVLASGRSGVPTEEQALAAVRNGSQNAPLLPTSAQAVAARNADTPDDANLVPIRPTGGSPVLDYPILRVSRPSADDTRAAAVRAVVAALTSAPAHTLLTQEGFDPPAATGGPSAAVAGLSDTELGGLLQRVTALTAPSRILVVIDQSKSMSATAGNGDSRVVFAQKSAKIAGDLLPDRAQVGLWSFARDIDGATSSDGDRREILDVAPLGSAAGSRSQRDAVNAEMVNLKDELGGNGTALYATAVAAMTKMKTLYDPRAGNAVVLFTDGADQDPGGPSLESTLAQVKALYDPARPVRLICVGIGPDADMDALDQLAAAGGGLAQKATDPQVLPKVLFEVMNRRDS